DALARGQVVSDLDALEAQRQADDSLEHETPLEELFEDQLACADLVLLTKTDVMDGQTRDRVHHWLQQQTPAGVNVVPCRYGDINPAVLLGFNAAVEDHLDQRPSHHDQDDDHDHDDDINSVYIELEQAFQPDALVARLQALVQQQEIYRIKGFVAVPQKAMRLVLQGVGQRFDQFYDRPWHPDEPAKTRLVFIGHSLQADSLIQAITA
ncbi:MAG: cobalamin biosynthesis protein CobW, partial [Leptolyngbyaceae cyanobacterium SM2_5_2]|nr:cobalamin biosynthesis protein CobW [Leptolyngbyaceae cyanobacterium SM2_5_2]